VPDLTAGTTVGSDTPDSTRHRKKTVFIAGDSIVKNTVGARMSGNDSNHYFIVKPFPGATISDMEDFVKPLSRRSSDKMILHVGTNDLRSCTPRVIADSIVNLVTQVKEDSPNTTIGISAILVRNDNNDLAFKALQANITLKEYCLRNEIPFLNNSNINVKHLNYKGLHLNKEGTSVLQQNLLGFVNTISD
jgi:lysophospholipase L1-like esterase